MLKATEKKPDTKEATIDQRRAQFPFWSSVTKAGKPRKVVIRKNRNYGSRKEKYPNWMKVDERETYLLSHIC